RGGHARRSLHHVCERLPPLGQRLPELDPGARRAHRSGTRGEGAHHGRERSRVLPAAGLSIVDDDLGARLERFVGGRLGASVRVIHLERSAAGFSQETFVFEVEVGRERRGYVAKREPVAGLLEPYDLEPEFRVLHALSDDPLPSPPTPWFTRDPAVLERPFYVMERLPGEVPIPAVRADGSGPFDDAERAALGPQVARALARLHAIDWRARGFQFLGAPRPGREAAERELARWEERIRRSGLPVSPPLAEALLWCRRHAPATDAITLVHGDYRLGNFLVVHEAGGPRLTGILDWELVHLGDPLEDVAWCASPLWRAGTPYASALLPPEEFAARWAEASGRAADPERLRFYEVLAFVKMIAIMLRGLAGLGVEAALHEAAAASAGAALGRAGAALGRDAAAARIAGALAAAPAGPPAERAAALRAALVTALEAIDALPPEAGGAARAAI